MEDMQAMTTDNPTPAFSTSVEFVDALLAEHYLLKLDHNPRRLLPTVVSRYQRDIALGNWHLGGSFIAFDECGCLVQGQHTLRAIIASGIGVWTVVFRGLTAEAVRVIDTGKPRTAAALLTAEGHKRGSQLAASVRTMWRWERGLATQHSAGPTTDELYACLEAHPGLAEAVLAVEPLGRKPLNFQASIAAPLYYGAATLCPDDVDDFFSRLESGARLEEGDPILALRNWVMRASASRTVTRPVEVHARAIKAWNAYIEGAQLRQIKWLRGGATNEPFPLMRGRDGAIWPPEPALDDDAAESDEAS